MSAFKVGDVCEVVFGAFISEYWKPVNGAIVTIMSPIGPDNFYLTDLIHHGMQDVMIREDLLRLKRPPQGDFTPGEWDLCPWKPRREIGERV